MYSKNDFPFIIKNPNTIYFDNAATTLKPQIVIDRVVNYYETMSSNVGRADYKEALATSASYNAVRSLCGEFLNVDSKNIVFTSGASQSINIIADSFGRLVLKEGDVVLLNEAEHASNVLPWFEICKEVGASVEFIPLEESGRMTLEQVEKSMHSKVKIVSLAHASNVLGYINDIKSIANIVHNKGAYLCIDGAQSVGHMKVDLKDVDADFFSFSAHKMLGPSGVGVLYGKEEHLEAMQVYFTGGGSNVGFNACGDVTYKKAPAKFEVGTPNIEGVLGFGAALEYINSLGMDFIHNKVEPLRNRITQALSQMDHIEIYNKDSDLGVITFNAKGIFAQDTAAYLGSHGICVRAGEHCAKLLKGVLHDQKSVRLSLYFYNSMEEVERFIEVINTITLEKTINLYL